MLLMCCLSSLCSGRCSVFSVVIEVLFRLLLW